MTTVVSTELRVLRRGIKLLNFSTSLLCFMFTISVVPMPLDITAVINAADKYLWLSL